MARIVDCETFLGALVYTSTENRNRHTSSDLGSFRNHYDKCPNCRVEMEQKGLFFGQENEISVSGQKIWSKEEILKIWPQAKGELQGFQRHLERNAGITAAQLGMSLQLAEVEFQRLKKA